MKITFNAESSYKTIFVSMQHVAHVSALMELAASPDAWFCHATDDGVGCIVRFGALGSNWSEIAESLDVDKLDDAQPGMYDLFSAAYDDGYHAVHFDGSMPLVPGAMFFLDEASTCFTPLAYDLPIIGFNDLTDDQMQEMIDDYGQDEAESGQYFVMPGGALYSMADVMRLDPESDLLEYIDGELSQSAFSQLGVKLSDDSDSVTVYHIS